MTTELQSLSAGEKQQEEKIDLKKKVVQLNIATEEYNHLLKSVNVETETEMSTCHWS